MIVFGKLESGQVTKGQKAVLMPDRRPVIVESILHQDREVDHAISGNNVKIKLKNVEEDVRGRGEILVLIYITYRKERKGICLPEWLTCRACVYVYLPSNMSLITIFKGHPAWLCPLLGQGTVPCWSCL